MPHFALFESRNFEEASDIQALVLNWLYALSYLLEPAKLAGFPGELGKLPKSGLYRPRNIPGSSILQRITYRLQLFSRCELQVLIC
jgi:hypothetical protein